MFFPFTKKEQRNENNSNLKRPIRKMTARSNSDTTLKQKNNEIGNDTNITSMEHTFATTSMKADRPL